jgi:murein tripeptide amidase MpaA
LQLLHGVCVGRQPLQITLLFLGMAISISSSFDSGNISVTQINGDIATLEIRKDVNPEFFQWFHFRLAGAKGRTVTLQITNCGSSAYPAGWQGYRARYSTDRQIWRQQAETSYQDGVLTIVHACDSDVVWFAYFAPYSMERHHDLIARYCELARAKPSTVNRSIVCGSALGPSKCGSTRASIRAKPWHSGGSKVR